MSKTDIVEGHAALADFFYWINERHQIYVNRKRGEPWPWTGDQILQQYKFTNCFRQLDTGTVALRKMIYEEWAGTNEPPWLLMYNIIWYRMFNWVGNIKWMDSHHALVSHICRRANLQEKVFTSAHLTWGEPGRPKHHTTLDTLGQVWDEAVALVDYAETHHTMQAMFERLRERYKGIGDFIAYEIVCDLRFTKLLASPDRYTWANLGPGCKRGLQRLGLPVKLGGLIYLYAMALGDSSALGYPAEPWLAPHVLGDESPFELREIEHSLCEFDKYQRVATGVGRPRQNFVPPHERD